MAIKLDSDPGDDLTLNPARVMVALAIVAIVWYIVSLCLTAG